MKKTAFLFFLLMAWISGTRAQDTVQPEYRTVEFYLGVQPGLLPVPFDEFGRYAFDVNVVPLTIEYAFNGHWALRIHSIWDVQFRPEFPAVFSKAGVELTLPYYLPARSNEIGHRGLYAGPLVSPVYDRLNNYYELRIGAEGGYAFLFGNQWSLALAGQVGLNLQFDPKNPFMRTIPYSLPRISFGLWF